MTDSSPEDAAKSAWIAGWFDGILQTSESRSAEVPASPTDEDPDYRSGFRRGGISGRCVVDDASVLDGGTTRASHDADFVRSSRSMFRIACSVAAALLTWGALLFVEHAVTTSGPPLPRPTLADETAADEDLFLAVLGETDESIRLAALRILLERAEQGRLASDRRAPLENLVQECASPNVALAAASVVKSLS